MPKTEVLYSRVEDGAVPITVVEGPSSRIYQVGGLVFPSARQLLIALTGHPKARNWTFDRYFKIGRHTPPDLSIADNNPPEGGTVIDLFGVSGAEKNEVLVRARGRHPSRHPDSVIGPENSGLSVVSERVEKVEGDRDGLGSRALDGELRDGAHRGRPALGGPGAGSGITEPSARLGAWAGGPAPESSPDELYTTCSSRNRTEAGPGDLHRRIQIPRPLRPIRLRPADRSPEITVLELLQSPVVDERLTVGVEGSPDSGGSYTASQTPVLLGIDLEHRGHEVVKLLFKGFGRKIHSAGYDPEDVIQEVFKGILVRNHGKSPWDARRSSFGHYVWMVCACVMSNYHRKQCRRRSVEQIGLPGYRDGRWTLMDAGSSEALRPKGFLPTGGPDEDLALFDFDSYLQYCRNSSSPEGRLAIRLLPLVHAGYTQVEMAREVGACKTTVVKALDWLKEQATRWGQSTP